MSLLIDARWIATMAPGEDQALENHSLLIDGADIADILPSDEAKRRHPKAQTLSLPDHLLTPGLINAHGHAAMTLLRNTADNAPLMVWLQEHIWPLEGRWVSEDFVADGTRLAIAEMLKGGISCFSDMYFFPEAAAEAALESGIRAQLVAPVANIPTNWSQDEADSLRKTTAFIENYAQRAPERLGVGFGPHAPYTVSEAALKQIIERNAELGALLQMHLHETEHEVAEGVERWGCRPLEYLHRLGVDFEQLQCVHMVALDDADLQLVERTKARIAHCPRSNMRLGSGFCPLQALREAGARIGLGTDGGASNTLSLLQEMRAATLAARGLARDTQACSAPQALRMATLGGAEALGWDAHIGSLQVGKRADVLAVNMRDAATWPVRDPIAQMVFAAGESQVTHLWVDGEALLRDGELTNLDAGDIMHRAEDWYRKMAA